MTGDELRVTEERATERERERARGEGERKTMIISKDRTWMKDSNDSKS